MNKEDILRMALAAGVLAGYEGEPDNLIRFAALVISRHDEENRPKPDATQRKWLQAIAYQHGGIGDLCETELEFGAMVVAAERERIKQANAPEIEKVNAHIKELEAVKAEAVKTVEAAVAQEREACAQIARKELSNCNLLLSYPQQSSAAWNIMNAIRARGQA